MKYGDKGVKRSYQPFQGLGVKAKCSADVCQTIGSNS